MRLRCSQLCFFFFCVCGHCELLKSNGLPRFTAFLNRKGIMPSRMEEKLFPNGDSYKGDSSKGIPHGNGRYTWCDGTEYEGGWEMGKMSGKGQMKWASGSFYEGYFYGGYFNGHGYFTSIKGYYYSGVWRMNNMHGFGRKEYSNLDSYEGSWKEGIREGSGTYDWSSGDTYTGTWKDGKMTGRGVMKWRNGDLYYGFWLNGFRHGTGVYRFSNGGHFYIGNWSRGLKDGTGTLYPNKVSECLDSRLKRSASDISSASLNVRCLGQESRKISSEQELMLRDLASGSVGYGESEIKDGCCDTVFEREYMQGILIRERIKKNMHKSSKSKQRLKFPTVHSRLNLFGANQSHYLMLDLQLGIRYTVGKITPVPSREVRAADFGKKARIRVFFPKGGSQLTPPHYSRNFHWKDYCPMVFRNLRELFKLDAADYLMSICGDDGLREICSPGKSGSFFYSSHDDRFVIKTLRKAEVKVLLKMLPGYYEHVQQYENTLITKFFGLHSVTLRRGIKVCFIVMGNMFYTELKIHRRYDLKGSTYGRCTHKDKITESTTLKDLDLSYEFYMDCSLREALFKQIALDCKFLESHKIIDYSLLLGLHFRAPLLEPKSTTAGTSEAVAAPAGLVLVKHEPSSVNTAPGPHIRGSALRASSAGDREVDLLLPGTARLRIQVGVNMPAKATRKLPHDEADPTEVELFEVYDVILYLGTIDILQHFNLRKKLEHAWKSTYCDPMSISSVKPQLYSQRFISFLQRVFPHH